MAFGVCLNSVTREGPSSKQCSTSNNHHLRLALKLFRKNQLSPSSIGISPLPSVHPLTFQRKSVRSSIQCYLNFNLTKGRSPGFGSTTKYSTPYSDSLSLRLHIHCLTLHQIVTRRFILQRHAITHKRALTTCKHTVSSSLSLPFRGTFHLSLTVLVHYRSLEYLALGDGPPRFRRNFTCSVVLRIHSREYVFDYRIITFFDSSFQMIRLTCSFVTPYRVSYNPNKQACWFGLFRFARRYSGNRFFFLFLRVLRCFSSPGLPSDML